jgi:hypothetical protein
MQELEAFTQKDLLELFKQYNYCDDSAIKGTGKNGRILKLDRVKYIYSIIYPLSDMDIFTYLKMNDIHYLNYNDLYQLSKINRRMLKYIDNLSLKMILNEKNIIIGYDDIVEILNPIYKIINNEIDYKYKNISIDWINKSLFLNNMKKKVLKCVIQKLTSKERVTIFKNKKLLSYNLTISQTISFHKIINIPITLSFPVSIKLIKYIQPTVIKIESELKEYKMINYNKYLIDYKNLTKKMYDLFFL